MLDLYVQNLREKEIDQRDVRLLEVTGLHEILDLLKAKREFDRKMNWGKKYTRKSEEMI